VARGATLEGSFVARVVDVRHVAGTVAISSTPRCGDATPDAEEECDDGNNVDGDGCESDCTLPACGDGVLEDDEECDDGNDQDGDGCESDCTLPFCGNGVVDPGEACDDGNDDGDDDCEPDCTPTPAPPVCGDGQVDPDERCDDGNDEDGDGCESDCTPTPGPPACGNGVVEGDEECDDGNDVAGDGCERDCTATPPPAFVRDLGGSQTKALASHVAVAIPDEPVPVGHTVVAMVAMPNVAGRVACGDTAGNRYAIDAEATNPDAAGGGLRTVICSAYVTRELRPSAAPMGAPGDEVFFDYPTAKATVLAVYEFEHLSPHPVHESLAAHDAGAGPEPPLFFTTTTSDALVLASIATATNLLRTVTPGDGWTALTPFATSGSGRNSALFPECLVTPGGDVPIGWRFGGGHQWALAAVALR